MRIPYGWLAELVEDLPSLEHTVDLLNGLGLEVDAVHRSPAAPTGVVVAEVVSVAPVEGSDHLVVSETSDGSSHYSVVCGALNAKAGVRTALALPGARLPGVGLEVERRAIRGVTSEGILCSPKELDLYEMTGGIIALAHDTPLGAQLGDLWTGEDVIELELKPNRADAFSLVGVARDVAAKLGTRYQHPAAGLVAGDEAIDDGLAVRLEDMLGCPRMTLKLIEDVTVGPSPVWLQRRLAQLGLRPRNNIVDVTNYVTFEVGQPAHAYDREALQEGTIVVRRAHPGEMVLTLTEQSVELDPEDLIIATPDGTGTKAIGIAGVIGGYHDGVNAATEAVALEVAHFDPVSIRKTAKRHTIVTDAHYRFERGVDPNVPPLASARAAHLIAKVGGGSLHPGFTQTGGDAEPRSVPFRPSRVAFLMDFDVPIEEQHGYLERLGCSVQERAVDDWLVTTPSWRFDLGIEEDLVEEVGRLHGYENIGETVPTMGFVPPETDPTHFLLRSQLAGQGLQEVINYVWTSDELLLRARAPLAEVRLSNPQGVERSVLRTALYPGLLQVAALNRVEPSLGVFEIGHVFGEQEREVLALVIRGPWLEPGWRRELPLDFYLLKGLLEQLATSQGATFSATPTRYPHLHPGVSATALWNGEPVGNLGQLHPEVAAAFDLPEEVYIAELALPLEGEVLRFNDIRRQPHAERDLALVAPTTVSYQDLARLIRDHAGTLLESIEPFDIYSGKPIPEGERSVALRLRFRSDERALTDAEVDDYMANIMVAVGEAGYDIRR